MRRPKIKGILERFGEVEVLTPRRCMEEVFGGEEVDGLVECYSIYEEPEELVDVAIYKDGTAEVYWDRQVTTDEFANRIAKELRRLGYSIKEMPLYRGYYDWR